jgi:hypothetical protein
MCRCLQRPIHPVDRKSSRPIPSFTLGRNGEEEGLTHKVLRSTGASEVQANHMRGTSLTGDGERGTATGYAFEGEHRAAPPSTLHFFLDTHPTHLH